MWYTRGSLQEACLAARDAAQAITPDYHFDIPVANTQLPACVVYTSWWNGTYRTGPNNSIAVKTQIPDYQNPLECALTPPPPALPQSCQKGGITGHPIIPSTGEKILTDVVYEGTGPHALSLVHTYRSHRSMGPMRGNHTPEMGDSWSHNHSVAIVYYRTPGTAGSVAKVRFGDGDERQFDWDMPTSTWKASNSADTLVAGTPGPVYRRSDDDSVWQFSAFNKVLTKTERNGWVTTYAYNGSNLLTSVTNHFGRSITFNYSGSILANANLPDGQLIEYYVSGTQFQGFRVAGSVPGANRVTKSYQYLNTSFPTLVTRVIDELGTNPFKTFTYDAQGRATSSLLAGSVGQETVAYGTSTAAVTDMLGKSRTYAYGSAKGQLAVISASDPASGDSAASRVQDANGFLTQETDFLGVNTMYTWDINRRLPLSTTLAEGLPEEKAVSTQWHSTLRVPQLLTEPGRTTTYTYDSVGNKLSETVTDTATGATRTWAWTYNAQQLIATETAPNGGVTQYGYDAYGQVTSITDPLSHVSTLVYNTKGQVITQTAPNGQTTTFTYEQRGRLWSSLTNGLSTVYAYRPNGQLGTLFLPNGRVITYNYDSAARLTGWTDNRGSSVVYTLDAAGNRTGEQLKDGSTVVWQLARTINNLNRVTNETVGSGGTAQSETFGYNLNGDLTSQTNGLSQSTSYGLDGLKRITAITNAANATANLSYNGLDAVTSASDFKGASTTYNRNAFGEATQEASADAGTRVTAYDGQGLPTQVVDAMSQATTIQRDLLGRPTQLTFQDGKITYLRYDLTGSDHNVASAPNASKGFLSEIEDRSGTTKWQRDAMGRVTRQLQVLRSGTTQTTTYSFNSQGLLDTLTYPGGGALKHLYTAQGRLSSLQWNGVNLVTGITWNAGGQPTGWSWAFASPIPVTRTYDTAGRMTAASEFGSWSYDAAGRITSLTQNLGQPADSNPLNTSVSFATVTFTVGYDAVGRITSFADNQGNSTAFTYDANGNRLTSTEVKGSTTIARTYSVDPVGNKLLGFTQVITGTAGSSSSVVSYTYNLNGELTGNGLAQYGFNPENRLSSVTIGNTDTSPTTRYAHNALGQRTFKTEPLFEDITEQPGDTGFWASLANFFSRFWSPTVTPAEQLGFAYVYDQDGTLLGEYGSGGPSSTGSSQYIWLPTPNGPMPIAAIVNGTKYAVHADHLNTPRKLTNASGQAAWQWKYSAFGDEQPTKAANRFVDPTVTPGAGSGTVVDVNYNIRYPGQYADSESGLHYNYFRSYDAKAGRYSQPDPIGLEGGWNRFSYVSGDPLSYVDPQGLLEIYRGDGVTFHSYPGPPAGGNEHARAGAGQSYHMHMRDSQGREARMSTETWKPLTPEDERVFNSSKQMQKACDNLTDGQKKFFDRVNREVFHRGVPNDRQLTRLLMMRGGAARAGRGSE